MSKYTKPSNRRLAKATGVGLMAAGLLLGAPAGLAFADDGGGPLEKAVVAGSQTYQQAVVAGSQSFQTAATATSHTLSSALKGLFGH